MHQVIYNDGFYIASAPKPVSNKVFMKTLCNKTKVTVGLPAPKFVTRFGAKYLFKNRS